LQIHGVKVAEESAPVKRWREEPDKAQAHQKGLKKCVSRPSRANYKEKAKRFF
jgi:hypothetical protein